MKTEFSSYESAKRMKTKYQIETGCGWDMYSTQGVYTLAPIVTLATRADPIAGKKLSPFVGQQSKGFVELAELSGLSIADTLAGAQHLVRTCVAIPTVNCNGRFAGVYLSFQEFQRRARNVVDMLRTSRGIDNDA